MAPAGNSRPGRLNRNRVEMKTGGPVARSGGPAGILVPGHNGDYLRVLNAL